MTVLIDRAAEETPATRRPQKRGNALTKETRLPAIDAYIAERLASPHRPGHFRGPFLNRRRQPLFL